MTTARSRVASAPRRPDPWCCTTPTASCSLTAGSLVRAATRAIAPEAARFVPCSTEIRKSPRESILPSLVVPSSPPVLVSRLHARPIGLERPHEFPANANRRTGPRGRDQNLSANRPDVRRLAPVSMGGRPGDRAVDFAADLGWGREPRARACLGGLADRGRNPFVALVAGLQSGRRHAHAARDRRRPNAVVRIADSPVRRPPRDALPRLRLAGLP